MKSLDIAIIGMAGRFPGASNIDELWANLRAGVESITRFTDDELREAGVPEHVRRNPDVPAAGVLADADLFDAEFFGLTPREAEITDPQQCVLLECAWEALEHAGHAPSADHRSGRRLCGTEPGHLSVQHLRQSTRARRRGRVPDAPRPVRLGAHSARETLPLGAPLSAAITRVSRAARVTPFMTLLAALLEACAHQDLPFARLVQALRPERHLNYNPLFEVMFQLDDLPAPRITLPRVTVEAFDFVPDRRRPICC